MTPARTLPAPPRLPPALREATLPDPVLDVLRTLAAAGHRSWIVGGAVRDLLLRRRCTVADHDVATPARPEEVLRLFPRVVPTGIEHGTVTVLSGGLPVEVTTFRGEGAYHDGRRPSSVTFIDDLRADLERRDFTVNALAWDPLGHELRDPFGGRADLRARLLRAVGDPAARFAEDGLRPLRGVRFAAQLGFTLEPATAAAIPGALPVTARVAAERMAEELSRLLTAPHVREGLRLLEATGLLWTVVPELAGLDPALLRHAWEAAAACPPDLPLRAAAALHALAAPLPAAEAGPRVRALLARLRFPGRVAERAGALVGAHGCLLHPARPPPPAAAADLRRWLARVGRELAPEVLQLWRADGRALHPPDRSRRALAALRQFRGRLGRVERERPPLTAGELALDGRAIMEALGQPAGPVVGAAVRHLVGVVLEDPALNTPEALASELRRWKPAPSTPDP